MNEIWKSIEGYEGVYSVSSFGNVRSESRVVDHPTSGKLTIKGRIVKPRLHSFGYHMVSLWRNNKEKQFTIHRLVALAFIPNPDNLPHVNHMDFNPAHNAVDNLEWCSRKRNQSWSADAGRLRREQYGLTKLSSAQVAEIRRRGPHETHSSLATEFGVCRQTIGDIVNRRRWSKNP
jgi:hypothetical protein